MVMKRIVLAVFVSIFFICCSSTKSGIKRGSNLELYGQKMLVINLRIYQDQKIEKLEVIGTDYIPGGMMYEQTDIHSGDYLICSFLNESKKVQKVLKMAHPLFSESDYIGENNTAQKERIALTEAYFSIQEPMVEGYAFVRIESVTENSNKRLLSLIKL